MNYWQRGDFKPNLTADKMFDCKVHMKEQMEKLDSRNIKISHFYHFGHCKIHSL